MNYNKINNTLHLTIDLSSKTFQSMMYNYLLISCVIHSDFGQNNRFLPVAFNIIDISYHILM